MASEPRILVIDQDIHPQGIEILRRAGIVEVVASTAPDDVLLTKLSDISAILIRKGRITARLLEAAPKLKIVARHGVGVDSIDLAAMARHGVLLTTTGAANSVAVAEYTLALMLALARHVPAASLDTKAGGWAPNRYLGIELFQRTLGIIGFGQIGRLVCDRARSFGMQILVTDPLVDAAAISERGATKLDYRELLGQADFLTYHVRLTAETRHAFDRNALALVKPDVRIINTARGGICDEAALLEGLESGVVAGVALDTFEDEPLPKHNGLLRHPGTLLTPHIGGQTEEAMRNMAVNAADSIVDCLEGRTPKFVYQAAVL